MNDYAHLRLHEATIRETRRTTHRHAPPVRRHGAATRRFLAALAHSTKGAAKARASRPAST
jgi:hypothetical protein